MAPIHRRAFTLALLLCGAFAAQAAGSRRPLLPIFSPHLRRVMADQQVSGRTVQTARGRMFLLEKGDPSKPVTIWLHGNFSDSSFFRSNLERLSNRSYTLAPDLSGFGRSEARPIDARRGVR